MLRASNVHVFTMREVDKHGIAKVSFLVFDKFTPTKHLTPPPHHSSRPAAAHTDTETPLPKKGGGGRVILLLLCINILLSWSFH